MAPRPVVKWAGGKTRLLDRLMKRLPPGRFKTYAEPFCGGGAMFFALAAEPKRRFTRALLADKNAELVTLYQVIKNDVEPLIDRLRGYQDDYYRLDDDKRRERFYEVRALDSGTLTPVERGARLLFLNRTCFNGLWRVNASGRFNVPFGKYASPRILDVEVLRAAHEALAIAEIHLADFSFITKQLKRGDFVYFDPPYVPVSKTANFTAYASDPFGPTRAGAPCHRAREAEEARRACDALERGHCRDEGALRAPRLHRRLDPGRALHQLGPQQARRRHGARRHHLRHRSEAREAREAREAGTTARTPESRRMSQHGPKDHSHKLAPDEFIRLKVKAELRKRLRGVRKTTPAEACAERSRALVARLELHPRWPLRRASRSSGRSRRVTRSISGPSTRHCARAAFASPIPPSTPTPTS